MKQYKTPSKKFMEISRKCNYSKARKEKQESFSMERELGEIYEGPAWRRTLAISNASTGKGCDILYFLHLANYVAWHRS